MGKTMRRSISRSTASGTSSSFEGGISRGDRKIVTPKISEGSIQRYNRNTRATAKNRSQFHPLKQPAKETKERYSLKKAQSMPAPIVEAEDNVSRQGSIDN